MDPPSPLLVVPAARSERWKLIQEIRGQWFPDEEYNRRVPSGTSPPSAPPTKCPALQEWFAMVRDTQHVWSRQDVLFSPHGYGLPGDFLIIGIENQSCAYWGIRRADLTQEDPPVFIDPQADGNWIQENSTASEFAVAWVASCVKWCQRTRSWAHGTGSLAALATITQHYPRLGLPDWHWPLLPTRFYGTANLLLEVYDDRDYSWFSVATRTRTAFEEFQELCKSVGAMWDSSSDEWPDGWVNAANDLS